MIELMINDIVPYQFGHKVGYGKIVGLKIVTEIIAGERTGAFTTRSYTIIDDENGAIRSDYVEENFIKAGRKRLEQLRKVLRAENISYGELAELSELKAYIEPGDVELAEAAGIPEEEFVK